MLSDPRVAAMPVKDCGEPLVEIESCAAIRVDPRERRPDGAFGRVRQGVLERLKRATHAIPPGMALLVIEGHRTAIEQSRRFDTYVEQLRSTGITDPVGLRRCASAFVSPVEVAPHCAGAAVDLTFVDATGHELDMGGAVNGHRTGHESLCATNASGLAPDALRNRLLLAAALTAVGMVNYPSEWWHWSYGDRYWALSTGAEAAIYGPI